MSRPSPVPGLSATSVARAAARKLLAARARDLHAQLGLLQQTGHLPEEPVHDLRVALRRLRVGLGLFGAGDKRLRARLRRLQRAAGEVRDRQLHLAWLAGSELPRTTGELLVHRLTGELAEREALLVAEVVRFAEKTRPALDQAVRAAEVPGKLGGHRLRRRLSRRLERCDEALHAGRLLEEGPAHRLRIALKSLRYESELLEPAWPQVLGALLQLLQPLQESLGALHDTDLRLALSREAGLVPLVQRLGRERLGLVRKLTAEMMGWSRTGRLRALAEGLRRGPRALQQKKSPR